jgi:hypothetical protein
MIADGDTAVNVVRAERCAALTVTSSNLLKKFPPLRGDTATPVTLEELAKKPRTPPLKRITAEVLTNVFVYLRDAGSDAHPTKNRPHSRRGQIVQVQTKLNEIPKLAEDPCSSACAGDA